jgi:hypothetical protein
VKIQEYPKWVAVSGPGHPANPGKVLVENEEQEVAAIDTGKGPDHLNPPVDEERATAVAVAPIAQILAGGVSDKPLSEQSREELCATMAALVVQSPLSDDEIREQVEGLKSYLERRGLGSNGPDDHEDKEELRDPIEPITDAAGDPVPPPVDQEANKDGLDPATRTLPLPDAEQGADARPEAAKEREAGDKPATDQVAAAETAPDEKQPPEQGGAKASRAKK